MQVNVPLDLETTCWACDGTGTPDDARYRNDAGKCDHCDGVGYRLTDFGEAVITMLRRHKAALNDA